MAVTIVIVGVALVLLMQGLGGSKAKAYFTRNYKIANQLARQTMGEVASGLYRDDAEFGVEGTYAEFGYPEFTFEIFFGSDDFPTDTDSSRDEGFDSWAHQREQEERRREREEEQNSSTYRAGETDEDEIREPYEQVMVRVRFPVVGDYDDIYVLHEWIAWDQVYGPEEEEESSTVPADGSSGSNTDTGGGR
ncbi:MAG: hypothetical protein R3F34_15230 [Planctomycetota bacterium]